MKRDGGWRLGAAGWALSGLLLVRAGAAFLPTMWAWGLNLQRFLAPIPAWLPWIAAAATLHPALAARLAPRLDRAGDAMLRRRWVAGLAVAVVVGCLPDRTWMTGDFLIREAATGSGGAIISFTEALPLERLLFKEIPRSVVGLSGADPNVAMRVFGALAAGALAMTVLALMGAWGFAGRAALAGAASALLGGHLIAFTGLAKPAGLVSLLTALALLAATRLAREGRRGALLGATVGIALFTHRSAVTLLPLWAVAVALAFRRRARGEPVGRGAWLALLLPPAAALAIAPAVREIVARYDLPNHLAPADLAAGGLLGAALAPLHLADLANLLLFYSPLLPVAAVIALAFGPRRPRTLDGGLALVLALTFVPVLLFVHPRQGIFRDLEVFAPAGVAIALLAGRVLARALAAGRIAQRVAPAVVAIAAMHALQCLTLFNDPAAGFQRTRAFATEPPARPARELGQVWDFLAYRAFQLGQWDDAVVACTQSVRHGPHPRALHMLAIARTYTGDHRGAESVYVDLSRRTPDDPLVWLGMGGSALRVGDSVQFARARAKLDAYPPHGPEARLIRRHLRVFPEVWPDLASGAGGETGGTRR